MWNKLRILKHQKEAGTDERYFSLDGKSVLFDMEPIPYADFESFTYCGSFAKDKNRCYRVGSTYKDADPDTFEVLNIYFARDKNNIYVLDGVEKKLDHDTFEVLDDGLHVNGIRDSQMSSYSKDKNGIWVMEYYSHTPMLIKGADVATFQIIDASFSKDSKNVYYKGKKIPKVKPEIFTPLNCNYGKDDKYISCHNKIVKGADYETFEVFENKNMLTYGKDKDNYFYLDDFISEEDFQKYSVL